MLLQLIKINWLMGWLLGIWGKECNRWWLMLWWEGGLPCKIIKLILFCQTRRGSSDLYGKPSVEGRETFNSCPWQDQGELRWPELSGDASCGGTYSLDGECQEDKSHTWGDNQNVLCSPHGTLDTPPEEDSLFLVLLNISYLLVWITYKKSISLTIKSTHNNNHVPP